MKNILNGPRVKRALGWAIAFAVMYGVLWLAHHYTPPQHNPFRPLDLNDPIGAATFRKFTTIKYDREACFTALDNADIAYTPLEDRETAPGCGFRNALTLDRTLTPYSATLSMTCVQTAALYTWEKQVLRPAAEDLLGSPVARINTYGSLSCRTIAGSRRMSQHATANAIDISGVRLEDGRTIDVKTHWGQDTPEADFLERAFEGACNLFSVVLGPDYNRAHADHFHFDMGSGNVCR
ncbi:MAG: extensin family protein [Pseudomonadota bacterium]